MEKKGNWKLAGCVLVLVLVISAGLFVTKKTVFSGDKEIKSAAEGVNVLVRDGAKSAVFANDVVVVNYGSPNEEDSNEIPGPVYADTITGWYDRNSIYYYNPNNSEIISEKIDHQSSGLRLRIVGVRDTENDFKLLDIVSDLKAGHTYITQVLLENLSDAEISDVELGIYLPRLTCGDCGCELSTEANIANGASRAKYQERLGASEDLILEYIPDSASILEINAGYEGFSCARGVWETARLAEYGTSLETSYDRVGPHSTKLITFRFRAVKRAEYEAVAQTRAKTPLEVQLQGIYGVTEAMEDITPETLTSAELWRMLQQGKINSVDELMAANLRYAVVADVTIPKWVTSQNSDDDWRMDFDVASSLINRVKFDITTSLKNHELNYEMNYTYAFEELKFEGEGFSEAPVEVVDNGVFLWDSQSGTIIWPHISSMVIGAPKVSGYVNLDQIKPGKYYLVVVCG